MSNPKKVTASSGNVFADLGFGNPEEELFKAKLVREIRGILKRRKLTQTKAAAMLGLKQPDVSALVTGRVGKFSIDRLVRCLDRMDYKVDIVVRHKAVGLLRGPLRPRAVETGVIRDCWDLSTGEAISASASGKGHSVAELHDLGCGLMLQSIDRALENP
jgi:predicted XRE-type DNA-binding protein